MELKWLEDFLSLAETRSFSRSAEDRNVTQSAFSRRVRQLELWLGFDLIDRSRYPISLTAEGRQFRETAEEVLRMMTRARSPQPGRPNLPTVTVTALHTLTLTFFPGWFSGIRARIGPVASRVLPDNFHLCIQSLVEGGYDFMLTYHHPSVPIPLDPVRFAYLTVGHDSLVPVINPAFLDGWMVRGSRLPLLQYSRGSFLGLLTVMAQGQEGTPETYVAHTDDGSMAEALKFMAVAGHGLAWLPRSLVEAELASGALKVMGPELPMEIRLYRSASRSRPLMDTVWQAAGQGYAKAE